MGQFTLRFKNSNFELDMSGDAEQLEAALREMKTLIYEKADNTIAVQAPIIPTTFLPDTKSKGLPALKKLPIALSKDEKVYLSKSAKKSFIQEIVPRLEARRYTFTHVLRFMEARPGSTIRYFTKDIRMPAKLAADFLMALTKMEKLNFHAHTQAPGGRIDDPAIVDRVAYNLIKYMNSNGHDPEKIATLCDVNRCTVISLMKRKYSSMREGTLKRLSKGTGMSIAQLTSPEGI